MDLFGELAPVDLGGYDPMFTGIKIKVTQPTTKQLATYSNMVEKAGLGKGEVVVNPNIVFEQRSQVQRWPMDVILFRLYITYDGWEVDSGEREKYLRSTLGADADIETEMADEREQLDKMFPKPHGSFDKFKATADKAGPLRFVEMLDYAFRAYYTVRLDGTLAFFRT